MSPTFRSIKKFVIIRNLAYFIFKIIASLLSVVFISVIVLVIVLSTKKRSINSLNNYIHNYINNIENIDAEFDSKDTVVYLNGSLGLRYDIKNLVIRHKDSKANLPKFSIVIDFSKLLFGKVVIENIIVSDADFNIVIPKNKTGTEIKNESANFLSSIQNNIQYILKKSIFIDKFTIRNSILNFINYENEKLNIKIIEHIIGINLEHTDITLNQNTLFNMDNDLLNTESKISCKTNKVDRICLVNIKNLNFNKLVYFIPKNNEFYTYFENIKGIFNIKLDFILDNNSFEFKNGNLEISSDLGSFDLREFFDEKIIFSDLNIKSDFKNNFKVFSLSSVNAHFGDIDFGMSMYYKDKESYKNIDLNFDIKNINFSKLKKFWPNFLGENDARPWVISHITSGISPRAWAKMNIKYFKDKKQQSGLQTIESEILMKDTLLNYNDYFPQINNINGVAKFTKNNMSINLKSGNVLSSKILDGNIFMDLNKKKKNLAINLKTSGPFSDLFVHIDKKDKDVIEEIVRGFVDDFSTNSNLSLLIPIVDDLNFNMTEIHINSVVLNKSNSILINSSSIPISFEKKINNNNFSGKIDLTKNHMEYLPLNIHKPEGKDLIFTYKCQSNNGVINIDEFNSTNDYIKFITSGHIDIVKDKYEVNVENISYDSSKYNLYYKSYISNNTIYNNIEIDGNNLNYSNILNKIKNSKFNNKSSTTNSKVNSITNLDLNLKSLDFKDNKKLYNPTLKLTIENKNLENLEFLSKLDNKTKDPKITKVTLNQKKGIYSLYSDDFGRLFDIIEVTSSINGGAGEINIFKNNKNNKNILEGNLQIDKQFSIITDQNLNEDVLTDIKNDKLFKKLERDLVSKSELKFERMRGNFYYRDDIVFFNEIVANSKFINLSILASGYTNLKTNELEVRGLIMPLDFINGLFGVNRLPIIGDLIFGQKHAGLFASNFTVVKRKDDENSNIEINKFSMLLPGFLRNIFDRNNFKVNYDDLFLEK